MARILIAEDEETLADLYRVLLARHGHEILGIVRSGDEAIALYKKLNPKPDIVLMDHRLERMSGMEALRKILEIDPNAKVVFASEIGRAHV